MVNQFWLTVLGSGRGMENAPHHPSPSLDIRSNAFLLPNGLRNRPWRLVKKKIVFLNFGPRRGSALPKT